LGILVVQLLKLKAKNCHIYVQAVPLLSIIKYITYVLVVPKILHVVGKVDFGGLTRSSNFSMLPTAHSSVSDLTPVEAKSASFSF
jgi:hypothetical protein